MHIILSIFEIIAILSILACLPIAIYILLLAMISDLGGKVKVGTFKKAFGFLLKSFVIFIISSGIYKLGAMIFL
jgi:hypothetical protein